MKKAFKDERDMREQITAIIEELLEAGGAPAGGKPRA